jgi:hypothetical protein
MSELVVSRGFPENTIKAFLFNSLIFEEQGGRFPLLLLIGGEAVKHSLYFLKLWVDLIKDGQEDMKISGLNETHSIHSTISNLNKVIKN